MRLDGLARKLKQARLATGMSTRMVAERLAGMIAVSHATIANIEAGRSQPNMGLLSALAALYGRPLTWFMEAGPSLSGVRYRNLKSKVGVTDRHTFEGIALKWLDAYRRVEHWLKVPLPGSRRRLVFEPTVSGRHAALAVRKEFRLKEHDAVPSVISLLEDMGVRVMELRTSLRIDAMAARLGDEDVIVLNPATSGDRTRLNAGHELGHIVLQDTSEFPTEDHELTETRAFEFASHLLLTPAMLKEAFKGHSMVRLLEFKRRYGISMAAMIYRAEHEEGILQPHIAKHLWVEFSKRGWRTKEPGEVRQERATRFEQLLDGARIEQKITLAQAAEIARVREDELAARIEAAEQAVEDQPKADKDEQPFLRLVRE